MEGLGDEKEEDRDGISSRDGVVLDAMRCGVMECDAVR